MAADGFGRRQGTGTRPALVVVDLLVGFTDPESPLACDADEAVAATAASASHHSGEAGSVNPLTRSTTTRAGRAPAPDRRPNPRSA